MDDAADAVTAPDAAATPVVTPVVADPDAAATPVVADPDGAAAVPAAVPAALVAWEEAGLYDPDAPDATGRLALLEHLAAGGVTVSEMVDAHALGELVTSLTDKTLRGPRTLSASGLAAATGIPSERVLRIWLALGLPFADSEARVLPPEAADITALFFEGAKTFGEESTLGFSRVMAGAAAQVAEAAIALFLGEVQPRLDVDHATELERAVANEEAITAFDAVSETMGRLVREHAILAIRRSRGARGLDPGSPQELELAVCFVDLVGSTAWAQRMSLREQAIALGRFESAAWEAAVRRGGRVVKLIGDEAMVIASSALDASAIAVEVCEQVDRDDGLPPARGAVGFGTVLFRDGDYFGPLVNVVARAVKAAPPGGVVVTAPVRSLLGDDGPWRAGPLADHALRGIEEPVALAILHRSP